jgi:hypothetical protein
MLEEETKRRRQVAAIKNGRGHSTAAGATYYRGCGPADRRRNSPRGNLPRGWVVARRP